MSDPTKRHMEKARELVACPHPIGDSTCSYHWNSCRRSETCEMADAIAAALVECEAETAEKCAKIADATETIARSGAWNGWFASQEIAKDIRRFFAREQSIKQPGEKVDG